MCLLNAAETWKRLNTEANERNEGEERPILFWGCAVLQNAYKLELKDAAKLRRTHMKEPRAKSKTKPAYRSLPQMLLKLSSGIRRFEIEQKAQGEIVRW